MNTQPRPPTHLVRLAADLRAAGNAWERIADEVGHPLDDVRGWPQRFPRRWLKALNAAVEQTLAASTAEAILFLRKQLRSKDKKTIREASVKLVQIRVALERVRRPTETKTQSDSPPGYADRLLALVRGMTDEQIAAELAAASQG